MGTVNGKHASSNTLGPEILKALGLPHERVISATITLRTNEDVEAIIEVLPEETPESAGELEVLATECKNYTVIENK